MSQVTAFCAACKKETSHEVVDGPEITLVCTQSRERILEEIAAEIPRDILEAGLEAEYIAKKELDSPSRPCLRSLKFPKDIPLSDQLARHKVANQR